MLRGLNMCFSTTKTKYFSRVTEKLLLIDLKTGDFWDFNERRPNIFDRSRIEDYCVLKIKHYLFNAFDFQLMQEKWNTMTSEIEYYSYTQYIMSGHKKPVEKQLKDFILARAGGNRVEILRSTDESVLRALETEAEILTIHSLDDETKEFFTVNLRSISEPDFEVKCVIKTYNNLGNI